MFNKAVVNNQPASRSLKTGIRVLLLGIAMLTLGQSAGCKLGIKESAMLTYRDEVWARRAFNLRYANCNREYAEHFENGFRAGYIAQSNGGDGYVPALPPNKYRDYEYQSADGVKCINSWFEGYPAGVAAAKKDDSGTYHDIMISRMINSAISQANTKPNLPGDVKVVSADYAQRNTAAAQIPIVKPPTKIRYSPPISPPPIFAPATIASPPQASSAPVEFPMVAPAEFSTTPGVSVVANVAGDNNADQPVAELDGVADELDQSLVLPVNVTPVAWNTDQTTIK